MMTRRCAARLMVASVLATGATHGVAAYSATPAPKALDQGPVLFVPSAEAQAIAREAADLVASWQAKDPDRIIAHFAPDATTMEPGLPAFSGIGPIRAYLAEAVKDPGLEMHMVLDKVDAPAGSTLGYARGSFALTYTNGMTKKIEENRGRFIAVFKKQPDGTWKVVEDISASTL